MITNEELKSRYKGIRASSLSYFEISPKYFKDKLDGKIEEPEFDFLELGTKLHYYLLEPNKFEELYIYLDFDVPKGENQIKFCEELSPVIKAKGKITDQILTQAYKNNYKVKLSEAKTLENAKKLKTTYNKYINYLSKADKYKDVINASTLKFLEDAKNAIINHKVANELLFTAGYTTGSDVNNEDKFISNEHTIYWEHPYIEANGESIVIKSTPDRFIVDHVNKVIKLIDLKTTSTLSKFATKFEDLKYYRQMTVYWLALGYSFKKLFPDKNMKDYKKETYIVAIQTVSGSSWNIPVECKVFNVKEEWLDTGEQSLSKVLSEMVWHLENDLWEHTRDYYEGSGVEYL